MSKSRNISKIFKETFLRIKSDEGQLRDAIINELNALIEDCCAEKNAGAKSGITITDGPGVVSDNSTLSKQIVVGIAKDYMIFDEEGAISFDQVSTETLVESYSALEIEVDNQTFEIEDYSELIR